MSVFTKLFAVLALVSASVFGFQAFAADGGGCCCDDTCACESCECDGSGECDCSECCCGGTCTKDS